MPKRIDPVFDEDVQSKPVLVQASILAAANEAPPRSPISGQSMELATFGTAKGRTIKAWLHRGDRIVQPCRKI